MDQAANCKEHTSLMLSEVLNDIGVNERMVLKMRQVNMLKETTNNITYRLIGKNTTHYHLGSQSEGTTTIGLRSDLDCICAENDFNVIQNWSEWEHGKVNYLMIQDENTTPGYCFLQLLRSDEPFPATVIPREDHITDRNGRILLKNKLKNDISSNAFQTGPAFALVGSSGVLDEDIVKALPCKSWPQSASVWLEEQSVSRWFTQDIRKYAASTACFVVAAGSKVSIYPELEWRISTTLAERCLMFNLNITQIRSYVLMKMILKSYLNPEGETHLSSFMCKTTLLHSIENTNPSIWKENNLLVCLSYCLQKLHSYVQNGHCPHFIIPENNLMAGQFTARERHTLLKRISRFIENDVQMLLNVSIENLGQRLQLKLNIVPRRAYSLDVSALHFISFANASALHYINFANAMSCNHKVVVMVVQNENNTRKLKTILNKLLSYCCRSNGLEQAACSILVSPLLATFGTVLASSCIGQNKQVSSEALAWLSKGLNSEDISSRLKVASVYFSARDLVKTEFILRDIENQYLSTPILTCCSCWSQTPPVVTDEFMRICNEENVDCVKHIIAFCVMFMKPEINCVPHELQYEMFRSTQYDMLHRNEIEQVWMNWAVMDSLTYLYFLQYKTYHQLGRLKDKQQALHKLSRAIDIEMNLRHKDTALNILGQCMEQENRHQAALNCYIRSLHIRARNNAASVHICRLLCNLLVSKYN